MYSPSCSSLIFATHSASSLPLGARFIWGIKNPLSPDPIDIWASISEIITTSGQNPATWCAGCSPTVWPEGCSLVPGSVCVCEGVFCAVQYIARVCRDVKVWKSYSVPFVSRRAAPLVLLGWRYEESQWEEKGTALFKAGFTHSSVPIWDTVPSLSPQSTFRLGQSLPPPCREEKGLFPPCWPQQEESGQPDWQIWLIPTLPSFSLNQIWN